MNAESTALAGYPIKGHMIALGTGHLIATYERNGEYYVAEFRGGSGTFEPACTWYRINAALLRYRHKGRPAVDFPLPLTQEILQKIERLHAESEAREQKMLAIPRTIALAAQRYSINVLSRLHTHACMESTVFALARRVRLIPRSLVTAVVVVLLGYVLVTVGERPLRMRTDAELAASERKTTAIEENKAEENKVLTSEPESTSSEPSLRADLRACDPARGISSDCVSDQRRPSVQKSPMATAPVELVKAELQHEKQTQ